MKSATFTTECGEDLQLLIKLARKMGISARELTIDELEDIGVAAAISEGKTGELVDIDRFLKNLAKLRIF